MNQMGISGLFLVASLTLNGCEEKSNEKKQQQIDGVSITKQVVNEMKDVKNNSGFILKTKAEKIGLIVKILDENPSLKKRLWKTKNERILAEITQQQLGKLNITSLEELSSGELSDESLNKIYQELIRN